MQKIREKSIPRKFLANLAYFVVPPESIPFSGKRQPKLSVDREYRYIFSSRLNNVTQRLRQISKKRRNLPHFRCQCYISFFFPSIRRIQISQREMIFLYIYIYILAVLCRTCMQYQICMSMKTACNHYPLFLFFFSFSDESALSRQIYYIW